MAGAVTLYPNTDPKTQRQGNQPNLNGSSPDSPSLPSQTADVLHRRVAPRAQNRNHIQPSSTATSPFSGWEEVPGAAHTSPHRIAAVAGRNSAATGAGCPAAADHSIHRSDQTFGPCLVGKPEGLRCTAAVEAGESTAARVREPSNRSPGEVRFHCDGDGACYEQEEARLR